MSAIPAIETQRHDPDALLAELRSAGAKVLSPNRICCPFHDDKRPSSGIYQADDGAWKFKCQANACGFHGDLIDVRARLAGRSAADLLRDAQAATQPKAAKRPAMVFDSIETAAGYYRASDTYRYTHPDTGVVELVVFRIPKPDDKAFAQGRTEGERVVMEAPPKPWPLYNRSRLRSASTVVVVEGEKCVHALHGVGVVATTSPGGAKNPQNADWSPIAGKAVVVWPDNDSSGADYGRYVVRECERLGCDVSVIDPVALGLPAKGDAADYIAMFGDAETGTAAVLDALADARSTGAASEVESLLKDTISGKRRAIPWPWPRLSEHSKALLPGTVTLLCGDPGATKSFMLLEAMAHWHAQGVKCCVFELEEDRPYHLYRVLAQLERNASLYDDEWVKENGDDALEAQARHAGFLDSLGRHIFDAPEKQVTYQELTAWVKARASEGYRVIAVDPVTAVEPSREPWLADSKFIIEIKAIARGSGVSVVLVTHPRKGRKGLMGLDEMAGGAAFQRFAQSVLWLKFHPTPEEVSVVRTFGSEAVTVNRTMLIAKARNGPGQGLVVGFNFNAQTLCLEEVGTVAR